MIFMENNIHTRKAEKKDIPALHSLLNEISRIHHEGRPDLFNIGEKYSDAELEVVLRHPERVVLVATDENDNVAGYAICILQTHAHERVLTHVRTLYLDDLCVSPDQRGKHVGRILMEAAKEEARRLDCYNFTLNVWACNEKAIRFYEQCGMQVQKIGMESIL